jgi:hypothetical protein
MSTEFDCDICGESNTVITIVGINRTGIGYKIPDDLPIPTCTKCGEIYISLESAIKIDEYTTLNPVNKD